MSWSLCCSSSRYDMHCTLNWTLRLFYDGWECRSTPTKAIFRRQFPNNATLMQTEEMCNKTYQIWKARMCTGETEEIYYVRVLSSLELGGFDVVTASLCWLGFAAFNNFSTWIRSWFNCVHIFSFINFTWLVQLSDLFKFWIILWAFDVVGGPLRLWLEPV